MKISVQTNAKINIGLNILRKREDNYHELEMIMAPIDLYDNLEIEFHKSKGNLSLKSSKVFIPTDEKNIIFKIYNSFYNYTKLEKEKISVFLEKQIPIEAGLGGGSSNGAFFLKELNKYHENILSLEEMIIIGKSVGADIPFFIENRTALVSGIGEKIEKVKNSLEAKVLLIKPKFGSSTKVAYETLSKLENRKYADIEKILEGLKTNNIEKVNNNIENSLEQALLLHDENIINFEKKLKKIKEFDFFMSGSGSCYFTLLTNNCADKYYKKIKQDFKDCFVFLCDLLK